MKKYILTKNTKDLGRCHTFYQIKYIIDIPIYDIKAGDLGGWIKSENNMSHDGNCVILDNVYVYDNAYISGNACFRNGYIFGGEWIEPPIYIETPVYSMNYADNTKGKEKIRIDRCVFHIEYWLNKWNDWMKIIDSDYKYNCIESLQNIINSYNFIAKHYDLPPLKENLNENNTQLN